MKELFLYFFLGYDMRAISQEDIKQRLARDNPWWGSRAAQSIPEAAHPRRVYFEPFKQLALNFRVRRASILLGPRRVGKTFMLKQLIYEAITKNRIAPKSVLYASIDTPVYSGISLERFLEFMPAKQAGIVVFDEIQYLREWEVHLKDLVDAYRNVKFIASGSAAAALRLKSQESGAGRFSEFMLPPLTFYEFLMFLGEDDRLISVPDDPEEAWYRAKDVGTLNRRFIDYLNYGGYPEAVLSDEIRKNPEQFIRNDIVDKVLLKDLPNLYGINEIQELNRLFSFLAYNAGNEASLENISQEAGISKPTIKRYIEYLESAFLIIKLPNVDDNCKTMKRERNFKVYLNNPSMRAALFAPVKESDSEDIGHLAESAFFSQWQHASDFRQLRYSRWRNEGEVDVVYLAGPRQRPLWVGEITWSDRIKNQFNETRSMQVLLERHRSIEEGFFTTKTFASEAVLAGKRVEFVPTAIYCYTVGRNLTSLLSKPVRTRKRRQRTHSDAAE